MRLRFYYTEFRRLIKLFLTEPRIPWKLRLAIRVSKLKIETLFWFITHIKFIGQYQNQEKQHLKLVNEINFNLDHLPNSKPNVILIVLDTVRAQDLPMYGGNASMPFLMKYVEKSTIYTNAYSAANWTIPSHASLFTGLYPSHHNVNNWNDKLSEDFHTLAKLLHNADYNTFCLTENPCISLKNGLARDFNHFVSVHRQFGGAEEKINKLLPSLKANRPFLLFINFITAHPPYLINPAFFDKLSKREIYRIISIRKAGVKLKRSTTNHSISQKWHYAYLCALNYLDFQLSILFYKLQEWGFLTNSLIIITSDHGEEIYNHEITNSHGKSYIIEHDTSYNTTIKIPLLIRHIKKCAYNSDDYISNVDIFPTILDEIGLKVLEEIDGVSVFKSKRNSIYSHNSRMNCEVVIKDGYKLIHYGNYTELYNICSDPDEKEKIIDPQIEAFLIRELNRFKEKDSGLVEKIDESDEIFMKNSLIGLGYL